MVFRAEGRVFTGGVDVGRVFKDVEGNVVWPEGLAKAFEEELKTFCNLIAPKAE